MRGVLTILICLLGLNSITSYSQTKSIAMVIAFNNFRDEELFIPKEIFENAGYKVVVFSTQKGKARGMLGGTFNVEYTLEDLKPRDFEAIVFVGGIGAQKYWEDVRAHNLAKEFYRQGKVVGAICIAPVILANAHILEGKKAVVWPSVRGKLIEKGARCTNNNVERDGKVVTATGPNYAREFALKVLEALK